MRRPCLLLHTDDILRIRRYLIQMISYVNDIQDIFYFSKADPFEDIYTLSYVCQGDPLVFYTYKTFHVCQWGAPVFSYIQTISYLCQRDTWDILFWFQENPFEDTYALHYLMYIHETHLSFTCMRQRGGGLGSSTIFKKFNEPYAPS